MIILDAVYHPSMPQTSLPVHPSAPMLSAAVANLGDVVFFIFGVFLSVCPHSVCRLDSIVDVLQRS